MAGRYVALLRGINVGKAKRVAMAALRALVEELGYGEVRTLLNSGNVVFSAADTTPKEAAARIQAAMESKLGVSARVMVISAAQLADVVAANTLAMVADNPSRLLVGILGDPSDAEKLEQIARQDWGGEKVVLGAERGGKGSKRRGAGGSGAALAVYMWVPQGIIVSKVSAAVSKALGDGVTARNWATMLKLKAMTEED